MLPRTLRTQSISGLCHRPLSIINFLLWRATFLSIKNRLPAEITYPGMPHDFLLLPCGLLWLQQSSSSHIVSNHLHPGDTGDWNWITRQELQPPSLSPSWPPHTRTHSAELLHWNPHGPFQMKALYLSVSHWTRSRLFALHRMSWATGAVEL